MAKVELMAITFRDAGVFSAEPEPCQLCLPSLYSGEVPLKNGGGKDAHLPQGTGHVPVTNLQLNYLRRAC